MTNERFEELATLCRWHAEKTNKINQAEYAREDYGSYHYKHNAPAFAVLAEWYAEKKSALNATEDEWNEYECTVENACERADYFARGEHLA